MPNLLWNVFSAFELPHWEEYGEAKGINPVDAKVQMSTTQLQYQFGVYRDGFVEIRCFKPRLSGEAPGKAVQRYFPIDGGDWYTPTLSYAYEAEAQGLDVYLGVLPRSTQSGKAESVSYCATVWADCDGKTIAAQEVKKRGGDTADMIVGSGHGLHLYWFSNEVLSLTADNKRRLTRLLKQRQGTVGSDPVHDFPRVLRLSGTTNWKNPDDPKCVKLLKWPKEQRQIIEQGELL